MNDQRHAQSAVWALLNVGDPAEGGRQDGEGGGEWSSREVFVMAERAWTAGWNAALERVGVLGVRKGGLGGGEESGDLRRLVGERFATALEGVWLASLRYLRSTVADAEGRSGVRVGSGSKNRRTGLTDRTLVMKGGKAGGLHGGGRRVGVGGMVVDESALAFKAGVDRKLRKICREMESWLEKKSSNREENGGLAVRKCVRCRRYAEEKWMFCPWDGEEIAR